ncbi:MAG: dihydroorotase [Acidobacteria bacterium]|nr:dihydroorotase [Acidobacteriota bacterium]MCB9398184.1 dihydroorotase [Acidobacteriota bacterium]
MELTLQAASDFHVHLRDDERTAVAIRATRAGGTNRVLAMPNTSPPLLTGADCQRYLDFLRAQGADFEILPTVKIVEGSEPDRFREAAKQGVVAAKQYPSGVTTNSQDGVTSIRQLFPVYEALQAEDMVLSIHGERPAAFVLDAEAEFLDDLVLIHRNFPKLRIVLEHVSTEAAVTCVRSLGPQVVATITDHHLELTLQDVVGSRIQPHHFCMPVAKRPSDRRALVQAVTQRDAKFFSGTDSAPHLRSDKESACGCAGIFNAPTHMQFLATRFAQWGILDHLEAFTSGLGSQFYNRPPVEEKICLRREAWMVPEEWDGIVPFMAGKSLDFKLSWC